MQFEIALVMLFAAATAVVAPWLEVPPSRS